MANQKVVVTIPADDREPIKIEAHGYSGKGCAVDVEALRKIVGGDAKATNTADYYRETKERVRASQG